MLSVAERPQAVLSSLKFDTLKRLIERTMRSALESANAEGWSVQGLGMLRYYLGETARLHIWNPRLEAPEATKVHTHSWAFKSTIISGTIHNTRYVESPRLIDSTSQVCWNQRLRCGYDAELLGAPRQIILTTASSEVYTSGHSYSQFPHEIHLTRAVPGTVTLVERDYDGPNGAADVYWPLHHKYGPATPRPAKLSEMAIVLSRALENFK